MSTPTAATKASFQYDPLGRRTPRSSNTTTRFHYDGVIPCRS